MLAIWHKGLIRKADVRLIICDLGNPRDNRNICYKLIYLLFYPNLSKRVNFVQFGIFSEPFSKFGGKIFMWISLMIIKFTLSNSSVHSGPVVIVEKFGTFHGAFHGAFFSRNFSPNSVFIVKKSRSFHGAFHRTFLAPDFSPNRIYSQKYRTFHGTFHRTFHQTSALGVSRTFWETTCGLFAITLYQMDRFWWNIFYFVANYFVHRIKS